MYYWLPPQILQEFYRNWLRFAEQEAIPIAIAIALAANKIFFIFFFFLIHLLKCQINTNCPATAERKTSSSIRSRIPFFRIKSIR